MLSIPNLNLNRKQQRLGEVARHVHTVRYGEALARGDGRPSGSLKGGLVKNPGFSHRPRERKLKPQGRKDRHKEILDQQQLMFEQLKRGVELQRRQRGGGTGGLGENLTGQLGLPKKPVLL